MFLLGYMPSHNRIYLADQSVNIFGYALSLALVEYQTAILRGDMDAAAEILPTVPADQRNKVARFLESQGKLIRQHTLTVTQRKPISICSDLKELALSVSTDPDHKFDLAVQLDDLPTALAIATETPAPENETKWKAVGDRALAAWRFALARNALRRQATLAH